MIQSVKPAPTDETDGLPMPKRIWAVISVGFALCMSVLDVIPDFFIRISCVTPYIHSCFLFHSFDKRQKFFRVEQGIPARFRDFTRRDYLDYQRLPVGNRCFSVVFFRDREQPVPTGNGKNPAGYERSCGGRDRYYHGINSHSASELAFRINIS